MDDGYLLRAARPEDAALIALQRASMFVDMGLLTEQDSPVLQTVTIPWIHTLLLKREYVGWFFERGGEIVSGGGLHLSEMGPGPGCLQIGRRSHIANVYTLPDHRRRGLARRLMEEMLNWSRHNGFAQITLEASVDGRRLYESLGFADAPIMRQTIAPQVLI